MRHKRDTREGHKWRKKRMRMMRIDDDRKKPEMKREMNHEREKRLESQRG